MGLAVAAVVAHLTIIDWHLFVFISFHFVSFRFVCLCNRRMERFEETNNEGDANDDDDTFTRRKHGNHIHFS